jgi:hypothetical protein
MHRVAAILTIVLAVLAGLAPTARADTTASAGTDGTGIDEQAGIRVDSSGQSDSPAQQCVDVPLTPNSEGVAFIQLPQGGAVEVQLGTAPGQPPGMWYAKWCGTGEFAGFFFVSNVDPLALADAARKHLPLPLPQPELSPAGDQIVNLPSWLWVGGAWAPLSSTVSVPGVSVTARAVPEQVVWTMGDGGQVVCDGPGTPYKPNDPGGAQSPSCAYTYTHSSATQPNLRFRAAVTVRWHATWSASGVAGGGDLGTIDRTTAFTVRVGEVQALNTNATREER